MKKIILSLLCIFSFLGGINAQYTYNCDPIYYSGSNVYTCNGISIATIVPNCEFSAADKTYIRNSVLSEYASMGITAQDILDDPSTQYNCHAYAWYLTEGNSNKVWINAGANNSNLSNYWNSTSSCFVEINSDNYAQKIHYYAGDHSAVKSTVSGKYESKWGRLPLIRHAPTSVPDSYNGSSRHYYIKRSVISGVNIICSGSSATFTITNAPASYTWNKSSNLTLVSTSGNTATFSGNAVGVGWVSIMVGGVEVARKEVCVGAPAVSAFEIYGGSFAFSPGDYVGCCPGDYLWFYPVFPAGAGVQNVQYQVSNCTLYGSSNTEISIYAPAGVHQNFSIQCRYQNACGWSPWFTLDGNTLDCANGEEPYSPAPAPASAVSNLASVYPSPVTNVLTVDFDAEVVSLAKAAVQSSRVFTLDISLYDNLGTLHRHATSTGANVTFDVSDLRNGFYFLHVSTGSGKSEVHKVIVNH
jgi:hypothetical protein